MTGSLLNQYFGGLYERTMNLAYQRAYELIAQSLISGGACLDCGTGSGGHFERIRQYCDLEMDDCYGIEWDDRLAREAGQKGFSIVRADLNRPLPFSDDTFQCVCALSVLEHLTRGCLFMQEVRRVLRPGGTLVLLTPNLSAWFNVMLLAMGKMPSSGPHPDSSRLMQDEIPIRFREVGTQNLEDETPVHRHLVVFSFRVLKKYLSIAGYRDLRSYGYGVYPFPKTMQPLMERLDPWHVHQMVFSAVK